MGSGRPPNGSDAEGEANEGQGSYAGSINFRGALLGCKSSRSKLVADSKTASERIMPKPGKIPSTTEKGEKCIRFSKEEVDVLAELLRLTLVGKFSHGSPSMFVLKKCLDKQGIKGYYNVGSLTHKHVLISFNMEEDFSKFWEKGVLWIESFPMRIFKWTSDFNPAIETPLAPVWINLPGLPCWLFSLCALAEIAQVAGKPLRIDEATLNLTKPSSARVLVEMNLLNQPPDSVIILVDNKRWKQKILYERIPDFCSHCKKIGHKSSGCHLLNYAAKEPSPVVPPAGDVLIVTDQAKGCGNTEEKKEETNQAKEDEVSEQEEGEWITPRKTKNGTRNRNKKGAALINSNTSKGKGGADGKNKEKNGQLMILSRSNEVQIASQILDENFQNEEWENRRDAIVVGQTDTVDSEESFVSETETESSKDEEMISSSGIKEGEEYNSENSSFIRKSDHIKPKGMELLTSGKKGRYPLRNLRGIFSD